MNIIILWSISTTLTWSLFAYATFATSILIIAGKMMYRILIIISLLFPLNYQEFKVDFFGLPAAKVEMNVKDTLYNENTSTLINFETYSTSVIKYIFNVNNKYETITSKKIRNILSFSKNTYQPNVTNQLETNTINQKVIYKNFERKQYFKDKN